MMRHAMEWKKILYSALILSFLLIVPSSAEYFSDKTKLAVFPFRETRSDILEKNISSVLEREFLKYDFIELVPLDIEDYGIYEIEPEYMWTGVDGSDKQGGIFWNIRHQVIQEIRTAKNAEYAVFGNIVKVGRMLKMEIRVAKTNVILSKEQTPAFSTSAAGTTHDELYGKVPDMAAAIADLLMGERVLGRAEEDVRRYLGRIVSYSDTVDILQNHVNEYPKSIPLRALLLDLYLKEKQADQQKVLEDGLTIVDLYNPLDKSDTRYLLSLSLDPFDVAAEAYEESGDWPNAILIRNRALKTFPFKKMRHRDGLARDHYFQGEAYEEKGLTAKAIEQYNSAIGYVSASSAYHRKISDGIKRTEKK
jgi:hypothetical protein